MIGSPPISSAATPQLHSIKLHVEDNFEELKDERGVLSVTSDDNTARSENSITSQAIERCSVRWKEKNAKKSRVQNNVCRFILFKVTLPILIVASLIRVVLEISSPAVREISSDESSVNARDASYTSSLPTVHSGTPKSEPETGFSDLIHVQEIEIVGSESMQPSLHQTHPPSNQPTLNPSLNPTSQPSTLMPTESLHPTSSPTKDFLDFFVIGNTMFNTGDRSTTRRKIGSIPSDASFIFHLGDIVSANRTGCKESAYRRAQSILMKSTPPVFITPGNNDWNECPNRSIAWTNWVTYFNTFHLNWDHAPSSAVTMSNRPGNLAFILEYTLFIGVHLVGGEIHDEKEWAKRLQDNLVWTVAKIEQHQEDVNSFVIFGHAKPEADHDPYFVPLSRVIQESRKPTLYIHAEMGMFSIETELFGVKNFWRAQVDVTATPLRVKILNDWKEPFLFERKL